MDFHILTRAERKGIERKIKEQYDVEIKLPICIKTKNKIWILNISDSQQVRELIKTLHTQQVGLYFATIDKNSELRLSFDATQFVGRLSDKTIKLNKQQTSKWLSGLDLNLPANLEYGWYIIKGKTNSHYDFLGCTKSTNRLINFVPKERRIMKARMKN